MKSDSLSLIAWNALKEWIRPTLPAVVLPPIPAAREALISVSSLDPRIPRKNPDVLVEMGREIASALVTHPEKYGRPLLGNQVLVVDDSSYEALFYLFSGMTRTKLWTDRQTVAALFLGRYCVMSEGLFRKAQASMEGGLPWD